MTEKNNTNRYTRVHFIVQLVKNGYIRLAVHPLLLFILSIAIMSSLVIGCAALEVTAGIFFPLYALAYTTMLVLGSMFFLLLIGTPRNMKAARTALTMAGLINKVGDTPALLTQTSKYNTQTGITVTISEFDAVGIPLFVWEEHREALETALNVYIVNIKAGMDPAHVVLETVPADKGLPDFIPWDDSYLYDGTTFSLGMGYTGLITYDTRKTPHIILGGSTGSGKSVELKCLALQAIQKGFEVCIADFKGGLDFSPFRDKCSIITDEIAFESYLESIIKELERRKSLFAAASCANIIEYNYRTNSKLRGMIIACDELAEVTDVKALDKEQKERISRIIGYLSTIARQGRAFQILLILSTQRPDANVLPGQIKNNIDVRACARADSVLSQIILDSTIAKDKISRDEQGLFIMPDGVMFRGFYVSDEDIRSTIPNERGYVL